MNLQKRLAGKVLGCSPRRIRVNDTEAAKEAITRFDVKKLIGRGVLEKKQIEGTARAKSKERKKQRKKGRRRGAGSRKGKSTARTSPKRAWIDKVRVQRALLKRLLERSYITKETYKSMYLKVKGGFFRSARHIKLYLEDQHLLLKKHENKNE